MSKLRRASVHKFNHLYLCLHGFFGDSLASTGLEQLACDLQVRCAVRAAESEGRFTFRVMSRRWWWSASQIADWLLSQATDNCQIVLAGHSKGGDKAFKVARRLDKLSRPADQLYLADPVREIGIVRSPYILDFEVGFIQAWRQTHNWPYGSEVYYESVQGQNLTRTVTDVCHTEMDNLLELHEAVKARN